MNNTEINEYIRNTVLTKIADINESIIKNPTRADIKDKIKSLVEVLQAKITDVIIKKEGGLIVKSDLDAELKRINDKIDGLVLQIEFNPDITKIITIFISIFNAVGIEEASEKIKKEGGLITKKSVDNC